MGAKIANPDYEDPHKLFNCTPTSSQLSLTHNIPETQKIIEDADVNAEPDLDMSISEHEVLTEFEKRWENTKQLPNPVDTGQNFSQNLTKSSQCEKSASLSKICDDNSSKVIKECSSSDVFSSQNLDSYYESIFEKNLNGVNVERNDSFLSCKSETTQKKTEVKLLKRPNKAPPPIPTKPFKLTQNKLVEAINENNSYFKNNITSHSNILRKSSSQSNGDKFSYKKVTTTFTKSDNNISAKSCSITQQSTNNAFSEEVNTKGWVKTIINRFE